MEVHAHSSSTLGGAHTPRKKWTHYLWEFLMLFLAVFCGFLAEYQLEHKIERDRSKQYIRSFYDDLKANLASFSWIVKRNDERMPAFNNIFSCYDSISGNIVSTTCLINMIKHSQGFMTVAFADGTIEQLKNAGGMRLLDKQDRDSIVAYDKHTRNYHNWEATGMQQSQDNVRNNFDLMGNFEVSKFLYTDTSKIGKIPALYSTDKNSVNKIFNVLFRYKQYIIG